MDVYPPSDERTAQVISTLNSDLPASGWLPCDGFFAVPASRSDVEVCRQKNGYKVEAVAYRAIPCPGITGSGPPCAQDVRPDDTGIQLDVELR
jgi:hypothetical protein